MMAINLHYTQTKFDSIFIFLMEQPRFGYIRPIARWANTVMVGSLE